MLLYVNNKPHESCLPTPTLADTLLDLQLAEQRGIAVAVNDAVVPRAEWMRHQLRAQDRITVIRATQGG
ncbi:sulfur carrier protein ThiS [Hymenobacter sp. NBH84]|uniref:Sulfur carrier protein ThiS n=1 Tax=Hymenobacter defluvii TaxID=2054411 RepID=A0ABS3T974_9BACT|nr:MULTISPECIES: sulfur carrier protein ThiS [Hymenobacter]MBO3270181.1 sulfur carrier protein ThiS [Hymenobacter defluvii]QNE41050.1 sulfur carrier protein ThiS [Hymenobacter sp. NBH84]